MLLFFRIFIYYFTKIPLVYACFVPTLFDLPISITFSFSYYYYYIICSTYYVPIIIHNWCELTNSNNVHITHIRFVLVVMCLFFFYLIFLLLLLRL